MDSIADNAMRESGVRQTTINGRSYSIQLLPGTVGLNTAQKIIKALGPALGVILDSPNQDEVVFAEDNTFFTDVAIAIVSSLDNLDLEHTVKNLLMNSYCDGQKIDFDKHFMGNYGNMIALVEFTMKENFGDFFTSYLKAKGLEIHTLRQMMNPLKAENQEESDGK